MNLKYLVLSILLTTNLFCKTVTVKGYIEANIGNKISSAEIIFIDNTGDSTFTESNQNGYYEIELDVGGVSIDDNDIKYPDRFELYQNYPNPFNPGTWIPFSLPRPNKVNICIYNLLGQKVKNIANKNFPAGKSKVYWDGTNNTGTLVSGGIYFYSVNSGNYHDSKKMLLLDGGNDNTRTLVQSKNKAKKLMTISKKNTSPDTFNVHVEKKDYCKINSECMIIENIDNIINKNITLYKKYHLCYNKSGPELEDWEIYLNTIDGNARKLITKDLVGDSYYPKWSPDGKYIIFRKDKSIGGADIYRYNITTDRMVNLTPNLSSDESATKPEWTPNGEKIVYEYQKNTEINTFIMDSTGENKKRLMHSPYKFYNDSYNYIYIKNNSLYKTNIENTYNNLFFNNIDTLGKINIWIDDINPDSGIILCHEDSCQWTFCRSKIIKTYNINSNVLDTIATSDSLHQVAHPSFSSDYSKITYQKVYYSGEVNQIMIYDNNKSEKVFEISGVDYWFSNSAKFSPHNNYIAFSKNIQSQGEWFNYKSDLYIVNINNHEPKIIDSQKSKNVVWNPSIEF